jgi:hypothetical protein
VAHEKGFSDFTDKKGKPHSIEEWLSRIESAVAAPIKKLIVRPVVQALARQDRVALAQFLSVLAVRTKSIREEETAFPRALLDEFERRGEVLSEDLRREIEGASANDAAVIHASTIQKISDLAPKLASRSWLLFTPPAGREFCTSDNPVLRFNPFDDAAGNLGLLCPGICLQLALSPSLLLCIIDPVLCPDGSSAQMLCPDDLLHYNALLAASAHRFLISLSGGFDVRSDMRSGGRYIQFG